MTAANVQWYDRPSDMPVDMRELLRLIATHGPLSVCDIAYRLDIAAIKAKCLRLVHAGLATGNKHIGKTQTYYSATPRGEAFACQTGIIAPPRTIPYAGTYVPDRTPTWRPGQDRFLSIASVGYRT